MHTVYWIKSKKRNDVGYTVDLGHRLRSHNGEVTGGAQSTKGATWKVHKAVHGFESKTHALQFEFKIKRLLKQSKWQDSVFLQHTTQYIAIQI